MGLGLGAAESRETACEAGRERGYQHENTLLDRKLIPWQSP